MSLPLESYFAMSGHHPKFRWKHSAHWRGYLGSWEIRNDRLYLIGLSGTLMDGTKVCLDTLFPGFAERVFAHWFSGRLRLGRGDIVHYEHMGFASRYAVEVFLDVERGVAIGEHKEHNEPTQANR